MYNGSRDFSGEKLIVISYYYSSSIQIHNSTRHIIKI